MDIRYYRPELLHKYPHMSRDDVPIWERYLKSNLDLYHKIAYDVRVGPGRHCSGALPGYLQKDWHDLTCKRVDAVGFSKSIIHVIEVKPIADARTYGQIMSYLRLFKLSYKFAQDIFGMVVCGSVRSVDLDLFLGEGIIVVSV